VANYHCKRSDVVRRTRGSALPASGIGKGSEKGSSPEEGVPGYESCRHSRTAAAEEVLVARGSRPEKRRRRWAVTGAPEVTELHWSGERRMLAAPGEAPAEASDCGVNRNTHRSAPGATLVSDSVIARSNECLFLTCGIAVVDLTYLWSS
jgi:hypothetical protein